jgi:hypothetical protein
MKHLPPALILGSLLLLAFFRDWPSAAAFVSSLAFFAFLELMQRRTSAEAETLADLDAKVKDFILRDAERTHAIAALETAINTEGGIKTQLQKIRNQLAVK